MSTPYTPHSDQVQTILASEEAHDWLVHTGAMHRQLSDSEVNSNRPAREPQRTILGVELTEEQYQAYLTGWTGEYLKDLPSPVPFYVDPIHSPSYAASTLGRLGGLVKSEAKAQSSKENGKKGGRPRIKEDSTIEESNLDLFK